MLSDRVNKIAASATMRLSAEAKRLKVEGKDVINLTVGEPDFPTPDNIKQAGKIAIDENQTRYTINAGTVELRNAIIQKLKKDNNLDYKLNEIIVSSGAKQSLYNAILAVVNPGDEVIVPAPYWVSYPAMVSLAEGKEIVIEAEEKNGFKITPAQLENVISEKTKALIICNPSNPTGSAYTEDELKSIAKVCAEKDFYIIADEIYEKLIYDDYKFFSFATVAPELKDRTIIVNGISKSYSMTGWRIGYTAGNEDVIKAMDKIQSHSSSHPSSISQFAAIEALNGSQEAIGKMLAEFKERREYLYNELKSINGITCYKPEGAFYLFPNISAFCNTKSKPDIKNSMDLAMYLLYEANVAMVPGSAFGAEGFMRISYATSLDNLKKAVARLKEKLGGFQ